MLSDTGHGEAGLGDRGKGKEGSREGETERESQREPWGPDR